MANVRGKRTPHAAASTNGNGQPAGVMGQRIRRLRTQAGKTLRAQAREIGIAPSSLSALENGQGGVSLKRLQLVAEHFGLHITELLGEPAAASGPAGVEIIRNCAAAVPGVRRGSGVLYQLLGSGRDHTIQPYLLSFEPGGGYDRDMIGHAGEEVAYVLHGRVELLIENERHELSQGDLIRFRADRPHAFRNGSSVGVAAVIGAATPPW
jgi:transcriptional regulator with XRE-family HTH domain